MVLPFKTPHNICWLGLLIFQQTTCCDPLRFHAGFSFIVKWSQVKNMKPGVKSQRTQNSRTIYVHLAPHSNDTYFRTVTDIPSSNIETSFIWTIWCLFPVGGYELNKEDHILALQEDETIITEALRSDLVRDFMTSIHGTVAMVFRWKFCSWIRISVSWFDLNELLKHPRI